MCVCTTKVLDWSIHTNCDSCLEIFEAGYVQLLAVTIVLRQLALDDRRLKQSTHQAKTVMYTNYDFLLYLHVCSGVRPARSATGWT